MEELPDVRDVYIRQVKGHNFLKIGNKTNVYCIL